MLFRYMIKKYLALSLLAASLVSGYSLAEELVNGRFVISFTASSNQQAWVADALEQNLYNDLAGYERINTVVKLDERKYCSQRKTACLLDLYKEIDIDALMIGVVEENRIKYKVFDVSKKSLVNSGSMSIERGSTSLSLRRAVLAAFRSFIATGGILDRKAFQSERIQSAELASVEANKTEKNLLNKILIGLAFLALFPWLFSLFGGPRKHPARGRILLRYFLPYLMLSLSVLALLFTYNTGINIPALNFLMSLSSDHDWLNMLLAGLAWGYLITISFRLINPHVQGLERVGQLNLLPLISAYLISFCIKLSILLVMYGFVYLVSRSIGFAFGLEEQNASVLLFPVMGVFFVYWLGLVIEVLAMQIDMRLTSKNRQQQIIWRKKISKYLISYLKRSGATLDIGIANNITLMVGNNDGVVCYGSFLSPPRIVVNDDLVNLALGDKNSNIIDYIYEDITQDSTYTYIPDLLPPFVGGTSKTLKTTKKLKLLARLHKLFQRRFSPHQESTLAREKITQGLILPAFGKKDDLPSLMSDNSVDMSIVEELMLEDTVRSDPYDDETEIDDSSENDKDFLYGILLHKLGESIRHDHLFTTIKLALIRNLSSSRMPYRFLFAKYFARVADTFTATNFALSHLMQYLYYSAYYKDYYFTTRGSSELLLESQNCILLDVNKDSNKRKPQFIYAGYIDRMAWLSRFCDARITFAKSFPINKYIAVAVGIFLLYFSFTIVNRSYRYHPEYLAIIENERQLIQEHLHAEKENQDTNND